MHIAAFLEAGRRRAGLLDGDGVIPLLLSGAAASVEPPVRSGSGTPAGVGFARTPPVWLKAGDIGEVGIEGIGTLRDIVSDEEVLS